MVAIVYWTVGTWITMVIVLPMAFPATFHKIGSAATGTAPHFTSADTFVLFAPMLLGALALGMSLFGLLPGTEPEDDEGDKG